MEFLVCRGFSTLLHELEAGTTEPVKFGIESRRGIMFNRKSKSLAGWMTLCLLVYIHARWDGLLEGIGRLTYAIWPRHFIRPN